MELNTFLQRLNDAPDSVAFSDTMAVIDSLYDFTPTSFKNGSLNNEANQNNGSCKLFSFARLHGLSQQQTLHCFGAYYSGRCAPAPGRHRPPEHPQFHQGRLDRHQVRRQRSGTEVSRFMP